VTSRGPLELDLDRAVTLRQLRTFKTVADLKSFSLAAQQLRLSHLGSNGAIKHAVESGLGLAVISRYACALELSSRRLVELDVRGFPIRRDWNIVHLRRRRLPASVLAFIEFLKGTAWLSRNGAPGRMRPPTD
jgi:DNA-binding transcriptional LysR family regulator